MKDAIITFKLPEKLKKKYLEYLEWESSTITEDLRNHIRITVKEYEREKKMIYETFNLPEDYNPYKDK